MGWSPLSLEMHRFTNDECAVYFHYLLKKETITDRKTNAKQKTRTQEFRAQVTETEASRTKLLVTRLSARKEGKRSAFRREPQTSFKPHGSARNVPAAHGVGVCAPAGQKCPAGHGESLGATDFAPVWRGMEIPTHTQREDRGIGM